jgi:two-component system sensor histidine kinase KdpD
MRSERPNPDALLARIQEDQDGSRRGRLKIFFGYAAGVGKTYAMLEAAQNERAEGVDVVVGYVEPHGRPETEVLLEGLEVLPPRIIPYRGVTLREFDLDAALSRKPQLILVDELAHTNAEGSRHAKRWQDVEELLATGINVYSTLNVQHVESLNDVIAQITGVVVRETLPDAVIERADEIELIDLTPEELIERLQEGKVYVPQQAERALSHFFQEGNLTALRELSLRQVANRLRRDVDEARRDRAATSPWATNERLLVCVGPNPMAAKLVRAAKRMAAAFEAEWLAVAVEVGGRATASAGARNEIARHLRLAEKLGAETHMLAGDDVAKTILEFARMRNVTKVVVGKTAQTWWRRTFFGTVVDDLLEQSGDIDIYVIRGELETRQHDSRVGIQHALRDGDSRAHWGKYIRTAGVVALCSLAAWLSFVWELADANIVMIFLLGVVFAAARYGRGPAIAAAVAGVVIFDFFFVPPLLSFAVADTQYLLTFAVMLFIGLLISTLTARMKERLQVSQQQERRTAALYRLTKQLSEIAGTEFLVQTAGRQLGEIFGGEVVLYLRESSGAVRIHYGEKTTVASHEVNTVVAQWVVDHEQAAGAGTDTLPNATALIVPLVGSQRTVGALGVKPTDSQRFLDPEQRRSLETCASLIALSLERDQSVLEAHEAQIRRGTTDIQH